MIKSFIFPPLCARCRCKCFNFLCERCLLGVELGVLEEGRKVGHLFSEGADFLLQNKTKYKDILLQFAIIQIGIFNWQYGTVQAEPELLFLKKGLEKYTLKESNKTLAIVHDFLHPTLLKPIVCSDLVLIV
jgi:hypothetical protein